MQVKIVQRVFQTRGVHSQCEVRFIAKIAKAKRIRFASLRRKSHSVRFAFASLFDPKKISLSLRFRNRFFVKMYTPVQTNPFA